MTTLEKLQKFVADAKKSNSYMLKHRKNGEEYVSRADREDYVLNTYIIFIGNKCIKLLATGKNNKESLIQKLHEIDWVKYSYHWAYTDRTELCSKLLITPKRKEPISKYYNMQADYLWDAMFEIVNCLESSMTMKG